MVYFVIDKIEIVKSKKYGSPKKLIKSKHVDRKILENS